jgi:hypothetical protein
MQYAYRDEKLQYAHCRKTFPNAQVQMGILVQTKNNQLKAAAENAAMMVTAEATVAAATDLMSVEVTTTAVTTAISTAILTVTAAMVTAVTTTLLRVSCSQWAVPGVSLLVALKH